MNPFRNWTKRDGLWAGLVGFQLTNITLTRLIMSARQTCVAVQQTVESVARAYEAAPVAFNIIKETQFISLLMSYLIIPAALIAIYVILRWYFKGRGREHEHMLDFCVIVLFFAVLMNFANDFGVWLGVLF